ncbi:MAG: hypothetical protein ACOYIF_09120, partial [Acetivibrionales bacterium]|jgi:UDP-GlcNAc:undecaprenyl-phosphate GlcNAc-1-phosphate transferase
VAIPILVLGLPIFDTFFAIFRRLLHGKPIGEADRGHLHHRLLDMGLSHRMAVISLYIVSGALGLVSIALVDKGLLPSIILLIIIVMFGIGGARNLKEITLVPEDKSIRQKDEDENSELADAQLEAASGNKLEDLSENIEKVSGIEENNSEQADTDDNKS